MNRPTEPAAGYEVTDRVEPAGRGLRIFQVLTAAAGAVLFVMGLLAVFRVDFGAGFLDTSGSVADFGFSPALAIAAIVLGGLIMAATLADQDRGGAAFLGLVTLLVGVGALIVEGELPQDVDVDRRAAALFIGLGAATFVLALIPWWSGRRRVTHVRR